MITLKITHNAGFFSCCSVRLHDIIKFFNEHERLPDAVDSSSQFAQYKNNAKYDISKILFREQPINIPFVDKIEYHNYDQFKPYNRLDLDSIKPFIEKYFSLSQKSLNHVYFLERRYDIDYANTIAVFYRGNDKVTETGIGSYSEYFEKSQEIYNKNKNAKFLIQTDETEFRNEFKNNFKESFYFKELPCINSNEKISANHTINPKDRPMFALNFLSAVNVISKCEHIVTHTGNCSIWAVFFRGNTENVHQFLAHGEEGRWITVNKN